MCIPIGVIKWILHDKNQNLFEPMLDEEDNEYT